MATSMISDRIKNVGLLLLIVLMTLSCAKIFDKENKLLPDGIVYSPLIDGPYSHTIITDTTFPSYMINVKELVIRIPTTKTKSPLPVIIIEPGFFSLATDLEDVENRYVSHGFLVVGLTNTSHFNLITTSLEPYKQAIFETIHYLLEASDEGSNQLFGLIDSNKIGISGHSMGGGGTLMACNDTANIYNKYIKTAIAMNPFGTIDCRNVNTSVFLFSSELDNTINPFMLGVSASPGDVYYSFNSIQNTTGKLFANFKAMDHSGVVDKNIILSTSGSATVFLPSMVSWFNVYLADRMSYTTYIDTTGEGYQSLEARFVSKGSVPGYLYSK